MIVRVTNNKAGNVQYEQLDSTSSFDIDSTLSPTSEKAVQNQAITNALNKKVSNYQTNPEQWDAYPTANSTKPVLSGGVKADLDTKQNNEIYVTSLPLTDIKENAIYIVATDLTDPETVTGSYMHNENGWFAVGVPTKGAVIAYDTAGEKVEGQKIVTLTRAQYEALQTKDANTYYAITDDTPQTVNLRVEMPIGFVFHFIPVTGGPDLSTPTAVHNYWGYGTWTLIGTDDSTTALKCYIWQRTA